MTDSKPMNRSVAVTSFDFLNGAYKRSANARLAVLSVIGVVLAAAMIVFLYGANSMLQASTVREQANVAFSEQLDASKRLTSVSSSGGLSEGDMLSHLEKRTAKALELASKTPSYSTLLRDLQAQAPSGITVSSVSMGSPPSSGSEASSAPTSSSDTITIVALGSNHQAIKPWQEALSKIPYLKAGDPTWTNAGTEGLTITITATMSPQEASPRLLSVQKLLQNPVTERPAK